MTNINGDFNGIKLHTNENDYSLTATSDFSIKSYGSFLFNDSVNSSWGEPSVFNPSNIGFGLEERKVEKKEIWQTLLFDGKILKLEQVDF